MNQMLIVGPRSRANSKASAVSGSGANSPRPSNSEAKGLDSSFSGISLVTRSGGFGGSESTPEPDKHLSPPLHVILGPWLTVFLKMMMYGTKSYGVIQLYVFSRHGENVLAKERFCGASERR